MKEPQLALLFKALSDENRIQILSIIALRKDCCACELLDKLGITQPTLSHHMKVLSTSNLVSRRKEGKWMHYSLNYDTLKDIQGFLTSIQH